MLILEAVKIKKQYGDRLILSFDSLRIYDNDRIGVVGINGSGKTTLLNILAGKEPPCEGMVRLYGRHAYITQLEDAPTGMVSRAMEKKFGIHNIDRKNLSGGENTRLKIVQGFSAHCSIIFADEPTCNLDLDGIQLMEEQMKNFHGALVLVSHDRALMDILCTKILEINNGKVTEYAGNYSDYKRQVEANVKRHYDEYKQYVNEKKRLTAALIEIKQKAGAIKKTPSRMGNSEARLHKRAAGQKAAKVEKAASVIKTRIKQLEEKEKPSKALKINMDLKEQRQLYCPVAITGKNVSKAFGNRLLFNEIGFEVPTGEKVALIGNNGSGKTTLLKMIEAGEKGIEVAHGACISYFHQDLGSLDKEKTILENVLRSSILPLADVRLILGRLLFRNDDVHKKVGVLSGGERVKTALAKIFVSSVNVIVLDEPTNYLDVYSLEALEKVISEYQGTILFVSHDRVFVDKIADQVIILQDGKAVQYPGRYSEYLKHIESIEQQGNDQIKISIMKLELRLSEIVGRLCVAKPDEALILDEEYKTIIKKLKRLRDNN
ncbi:MAG: ribosomal protection-like ABC-F family protein [Bacillota bacterium]